MQDLSVKQYKTLLREILCCWIETLNIWISNLPKLGYGFNKIPNRIVLKT